MKRELLTCFFLFISSQFVFSQQDSVKTDSIGWYRGGHTSLHFSQSGYTNWSQGGENTLTLTAAFSYYYRYHSKRVYWENDLDLGYGIQHNSKYDQMQKSEDRISLYSNYGRQAFSTFYYGGFIDFKTQFAPGYNYPNTTKPISKFMAPGYITLGPGMIWKPVPYFYVFLSPATGRFILVLDQEIADAGSFGVDSAEYDEFGVKIKDGKKVNAQFGAALVTAFDKDIFQNVTLRTKLMLFDNYTNPISNKRLNIDLDWQTSLLMKINSFLSASVYTHLIYDDDIEIPIYKDVYGVSTQTGTGKRIQFKEVIGVGFSMNF